MDLIELSMGKAVAGYGVLVGTHSHVPWANKTFDFSPEFWWQHKLGFKPRLQPFNADGEFAEGWDEDSPELRDYFEEVRCWMKHNPLPVAVVSLSLQDRSFFAIVSKRLCITASHATPQVIPFMDNHEVCNEKTELLDFLRLAGIKEHTQPSWLLLNSMHCY